MSAFKVWLRRRKCGRFGGGRLRERIVAVGEDCGQDFTRRPVLEFLRFGRISRQHQRIQAAFVDDEHFAPCSFDCKGRFRLVLFPVNGLTVESRGGFVRRIHELKRCHKRIGFVNFRHVPLNSKVGAVIAERAANIDADESSGLTIKRDADITELWVREHFERAFHKNHPFSE